MRPIKRLTGFTLIELIIAMGVGLVLIAGVVVFFIQNNRSAVQDEEISRVLENGRFVMRYLSRELAMSGFWGKFLDVDTTINDVSVSVGQDCGNGVDDWAMDLDAIQFLNNISAATVAAAFECLPSTDVVAGTDVWAVKRVADAVTEDVDLVADQMYMRTNGVAAIMFLGGAVGTPPALTGTVTNWSYIPQIFYIRDYSVTTTDGIPSLCRAYLDNSSPPDMTSECLVDGVENMQIEFGIDEDDDFIANYYTAAPTAAEIVDAVSARIYVLVRSVNEVPNYTNDKIYTLGSTTVNAANDGFFRRVFNLTVVLRNPSKLTGIGS